MAEAVEKTIHDRLLLKRGERILVAVSGGLDSMVLLHLLHEAASRNDWKLTVAHLNHKLRGKSSEADARLVERTAKQLGRQAIIGCNNVREIARREKLSLEMAARKLRHEFLACTARKLKIRTVALAHHGDDQLELFFLRLFRGSGSEGMRGMQWRNPSPFDKRIKLVRPLLGQTKAALAKYAAANKVVFREDASNASLDYQRNRIRNELLPLLRKHYQPGLGEVVSRVLDITGAEGEFVTETAREWLSRVRSAECGVRSRSEFEDLPVAVQRRVVQLQLLSQGIVPDYDLVEQLRLKQDRPVCISRTKRARAKVERPFFLVRDQEGMISEAQISASRIPTPPGAELIVELDEGSGQASFGGIQVDWNVAHGRRSVFRARKAGNEWFDVDQVGNRIVLRHWRPGDRFQPIGMKSGVKLQDFFVNQKVPRKRRHELVLAVSAGGEVFWVEGMRISERFKLTAVTNRRLQWRWQRL